MIKTKKDRTLSEFTWEENTFRNIINNLLQNNSGLKKEEMIDLISTAISPNKEKLKEIKKIIDTCFTEAKNILKPKLKVCESEVEMNYHVLYRYSDVFIGKIIEGIKNADYNIYKKFKPIIVIPGKEAESLNQIKNLLNQLEGEILWLDRDFDISGCTFFKYFEKANTIKLLIGKSKLGIDLKRALISSIEQFNKMLEVRILTDDDYNKLHDRILLSKDMGFVIPPVNLFGRRFSLFIPIDEPYVKIVSSFFESFWKRSIKIENL